MNTPRRLRTSVILPVLNEEERIARQLQRLLDHHTFDELLVVDGASEDRTRQQATPFFEHIRWIDGPRGRPHQMNTGARAATGDVLLFLHADVELPTNAQTWIHSTLRCPNTVAGAFQTWTVSDTGDNWLESWLHLADLRSRYSPYPYGDQALFVKRAAFWEAGGFDESNTLFEDYELSRTLAQHGRVVTVPEIVTVSGRRFMARPIYYVLLLNIMPAFYHAGIPPHWLMKLYGSPR